MERIKIFDNYFRLLIPHEQIQKSVARIANDLNLEYAGKEPPLFVSVLSGAFMFTSDLMKQLTFQAQVAFIKVSSYSGTQSTGEIKKVIGMGGSVKGREVIIIEDIVDTGTTLEALHRMLIEDGATNVKICTLLIKPDVYKKELTVDYVAIKIPNHFVVGYGLDYNELGRQYRDIYILDES